MPRLSILRLLSLIPLCYLCLTGLWLFLPSPTIRPIFRSIHIQSKLTSGQPLVTVHPDSKTFTYGTYRSNSETDHLAITYQLQVSPSSDSLLLCIDDAKINLTEYALQTPPFLSPGPVNAHVRPGATDHIINMPWFHTPDAILFHHHMHGFPADINLRVLVPEPRVVEIWKDSATWKQFRFYSGVVRPTDLFQRISAADREVGMLLRFRDVPILKGARTQMGGIVVEEVKGQLLSRTFAFRMWVLGPTAPMTMVVWFLVVLVLAPAATWLMPKLMVLLALYATIVLLWWTSVGRPKFAAWSAKSMFLWPLRRMLECVGMRSVTRQAKQRKVIWTASGPAYDSDEEVNGSGNDDHPRTFGKRLDEMLKGVRIRTASVDVEAKQSEDLGLSQGYG